MKLKISTYFLILISLSLSPIKASFQETLFIEMNKNLKGKNLIISPLSIYQALSLAANGAKKSTQTEILSLLENEDDNIDISSINEINYSILDIFKSYTTVEMANSIMTKISPSEFFTLISEKYFAPTYPLENVEQVNNWCSEKTHGKIPKILDKLDDSVVMLILNAIYFKGEWSKKFEERNTGNQLFYNFGKEENEVLVDTMRNVDFFRYYEKEDQYQAIEMFYEQDRMSAWVILPAKDLDINDFIENMGEEKILEELDTELKSTKVDLSLPKFEIEFDISLKEDLKNLGMQAAFSDNADFSGITDEIPLKVSDVIHKTFLKVTEDGTEAAGATIIPIMPGSAGPDFETPVEMKVDRPFLFIIKSKEGITDHDILFISKIEKID